MRLSSAKGVIELVRGEFDDPVDLNARAVAGAFAGAVSNIFPMNAKGFLQALEDMQAFRCRRAELYGTEDFRFAVEWRGSTGGFWAEITMRQFAAFQDGRRSVQSVDIVLEVDGEYWSTMKVEMARILSGP